MTDERYDQNSDPLVSRVYRELAGETSPSSADQRILARAGAASKGRYARLRLWTRPLAWAATIGLSLVIVLQLSDIGVPPGVTQPAAVETDSPDLASADAAGSRDPAELRRDRPTAHRDIDKSGPPSAPAEIVSADVDMLQEAEDMARLQSGEQQRPEATGALSIAAELDDTLAPDFCDAEARSTRESWLGCIRELEEQGKKPEAAVERRRMQRAFPDR